jgi:hypothetical protein
MVMQTSLRQPSGSKAARAQISVMYHLLTD